GDDFIFRGEISTIVWQHTIVPDNQAYRFLWWLPTAVTCRLFGLNELGLVMPVTAAAVIGIGLVYALGVALYGRAGGVIAALLVIVTPLDFAWSTMMTNDIILSAVEAATVLLVLHALDEDDPVRKRRRWLLAGVGVWLAFHGKLSGLV